MGYLGLFDQWWSPVDWVYAVTGGAVEAQMVV